MNPTGGYSAQLSPDATKTAIDAVMFEEFEINDVASANTSGLEIVDGNPAKSTLDVVVDVRAVRNKVS